MTTCLMAFLAILVNIPDDQSLREAARRQGGSASNSIDYFEPVTTLPQLVEKSDFVVHARILSATNVLILDDRLVATDYRIAPLRVLKQAAWLTTSAKPGVAPGSAVVRRVGGTLVVDGDRYSTENSAIPEAEAPKVGDELVLFLSYDPAEQVFTLTAGAFAAFRVIDGQVHPLTTTVATRRGDAPIDIAGFLRNVEDNINVKR